MSITCTFGSRASAHSWSVGQAAGAEHEPDLRQGAWPAPGTGGRRTRAGRPARPPRPGRAGPNRPAPARPSAGTRGGRPRGAPVGSSSCRRHGAGRVDGPTPMCTTSAPACPHRASVRRSHGSASDSRPAGRRRSHSVSPRRPNRRTRGVSPRAPGCPPSGSSSPESTNRPGIQPAISACHSSGEKPSTNRSSSTTGCSTARSTCPSPKTSRFRLCSVTRSTSCGGTPAPSSSRCRRSRSSA